MIRGAGRLAAALAWLLAGCAGHRPPAASSGPGTAESARARLIALGSRPTLFDGEVRVRGRDHGRRLSARVLAVAEPGGRFYVETVEGPPAVVAGDGSEIRVLRTAQREWLRTGADAASLEALLGLPLEPDELTALLAGCGAPPRSLEQAVVVSPVRLRLPRGHLELDPGGQRVVAGEIGGLRFKWSQPDRLTVEVPASRLALELRLRPADDRVGTRSEGLFRPAVPPGFREVRLADLEAPVLLR